MEGCRISLELSLSSRQTYHGVEKREQKSRGATPLPLIDKIDPTTTLLFIPLSNSQVILKQVKQNQ
jgi:hypothetical protein